ncbi:MAG TPA: GWxTD domain-containing protein [Chitinophagaceae bacterium]|nr:GWxTD domain-containing protein [Chitinophagaceae bacterium]
MRLKIIIFIFVCYLLSPFYAFAEIKDSINRIQISSSLGLLSPTNQIDDQTAFFDIDISKIFIGVEIDRKHDENKSHFLMIEIKKKSLEQFRLRPIVYKKINLNTNSFYIDSLDLPDSLFTSGNFHVIATLLNDSLRVINTKKIPFQLLREKNRIIQDEYYVVDINQSNNEVDITKTFVAKYSLDQVKKNILSLSPLAKGPEVNVINELKLSEDLPVLKQFFYNFWYNRNPQSPEQAWNEYAITLNLLAKKYGDGNKLGYETDRGRIYIQYGPPDRVERIINEKGALPHEVWFYYNSGTKSNVKFLFFQPGMLGNEMVLLHSNQADEIINNYWKTILFQDPTNGANKLTHKVYEFFN